MKDKPAGPLAGLRILDISTVVAGPFASGLLGDLGADVVEGRNARASATRCAALAPHKDGVPLWWKVTNRNKKGITLDLRQPDGNATCSADSSPSTTCWSRTSAPARSTTGASPGPGCRRSIRG